MSATPDKGTIASTSSPAAHPACATVGPSPIEGLGVFAARAFAAGEWVLAIDDSHPATPVPQRSPEEDRFCDFLEAGRTVIMQAPERHINHSCAPNVATRSIGKLRHVQTLRAIPAGEELTLDYSINGSGDTLWTCHCSAAQCRHLIHSDFFHLPLDQQQAYLPLLDTWFRQEHLTEIHRLEASLSLKPISTCKDSHAPQPR